MGNEAGCKSARRRETMPRAERARRESRGARRATFPSHPVPSRLSRPVPSRPAGRKVRRVRPKQAGKERPIGARTEAERVGPRWARVAGRGRAGPGREERVSLSGRRSLTDRGGRHCPPSGGCGRARAMARRAASSGPAAAARAACILLGGPAGRARGEGGPPLGGAPGTGAGGETPQLGTEVLLERGAPAAGCWEPFGAWLAVPAGLGGPLWGGAPTVRRGGTPSPGRSAGGLAEPREAECGARRGSWGARGTVPAGRSAEGSERAHPEGSRSRSGYAGDPGGGARKGPRGWRAREGDKCGGRGAGGGLGVPGCPGAGFRGAAGGRAAAARAPPCCRCCSGGKEGEREEGGRESGAEPGRAGGWGRRGGGRGGPGSGGGGRAAGNRGDLQRPGAARRGSDGHGRLRSLSRSSTRGGRQSPQQPLPNFVQTSQRDFLPSPARASSASPGPPPPAPAPAAPPTRDRQRAPVPRPRIPGGWTALQRSPRKVPRDASWLSRRTGWRAGTGTRCAGPGACSRACADGRNDRRSEIAPGKEILGCGT